MNWRDSPPGVFVVVLNWNGFEESRECVHSLLRAEYPNLHIVIVDNASADGSGRLLHSTFPDLHFVQSSENGGYAGGMNLGAAFALSKNAEYIILMNNDVVVTPGFVDPFIDIFGRNSNTGIVSPKVLYKDRKDCIYCAGARISYALCSGVSLFQGKKHDSFGNVEGPASMAEGSCLCVRASVFRAIGYFDPKYFMYFEDMDFSMRVNKKFGIIYTPKSIIYHKSGAGRGWLVHSQLYQYFYTRNRLWFFSRFGFLYRCYVLMFSSLVVLAKSARLWMHREKVNDFSSSVRALWKGLSHGSILLFGGTLPPHEEPFRSVNHS